MAPPLQRKTQGRTAGSLALCTPFPNPQTPCIAPLQPAASQLQGVQDCVSPVFLTETPGQKLGGRETAQELEAKCYMARTPLLPDNTIAYKSSVT